MRQVVIAIPEWPASARVVLGDASSAVPVVVVKNSRVLACNSCAQHAGVLLGMKKRHALARCPHVRVFSWDENRENMAFESIMRAVERWVAYPVIHAPGIVIFPAKGPSRSAGSEEALVEALVGEISDLSGAEAHVGIAEGTLAAFTACHEDLILQGDPSAFLQHRNVRELIDASAEYERLEAEAIVGTLERLGVHTIGEAVELGVSAMTTRFGVQGVHLWDLARGGTQMSYSAASTPDLAAGVSFEDPVGHAEQAIFGSKCAVDELLEGMHSRGFIGGRLVIRGIMLSGAERERVWSVPGMRERDIIDRVRWQLAGWLDLHEHEPLVRLELCLHDPTRLGDNREPLWGTDSAGQAKAMRVSERIRALVGEYGVHVPLRSGGRTVCEQYKLIPLGHSAVEDCRPWPGRIPEPHPSRVHEKALPCELFDSAGHVLRVNANGGFFCEALCDDVFPDQTSTEEITQYAGPWIIEQEWWNRGGIRRAYAQIVTETAGRLVFCERGTWKEEGIYA